MAYVTGNPKSKAEIRRRLVAGEQYSVFQPGLGDVPITGTIAVEGPHYPRPHTWYGIATIKNGVLVSIK